MSAKTTWWRAGVACGLGTAALVGCGSSGQAGTAADAARPRDPQANCVKPGSPGNAFGVGAYCAPDGPSCSNDAGFLICTAGVPNVPDDAWFCTRPCKADVDCGGDGALCVHDPVRGTGCVPATCLPQSARDGGADGAP